MHVSRLTLHIPLEILAGTLASLIFLASPHAADRAFHLSVDPELADSNFIKFLLPRFSLKHATRIVLAPQDTESDANFNREGRGRLVFHGPNSDWYFEITGGAGEDHAQQFTKWLAGETGQATVAAYSVDGVSPYSPAASEEQAEAAKPVSGDAALGERLSQRHCGRCHTVNAATRMTSIGSTPSFQLMRAFKDWNDRFLSFYALRPHPAFTLVQDVTPPFDPSRPPPIVPIEITLEEIEAIAAFVSTIKPADLGAPLQLQ